MRDIIVTTRGEGRSYRIGPRGWVDLETKTLGSEINQAGLPMSVPGSEDTWRLTYYDLLPYINTKSGILRVRYADG
jgi:hypothetical protein